MNCTVFCEKCKAMRKVEEVYHNATIVTPVTEIDKDGDLEYDVDNRVIEEGEVYAYQCEVCGKFVTDDNGHAVDTCNGLAEVASKGLPSIDFPDIFASIDATLDLLRDLITYQETQDARAHYKEAITRLLKARRKHVKELKSSINTLKEQIAMEDDRHILASLEISLQRLEADLPEVLEPDFRYE